MPVRFLLFGSLLAGLAAPAGALTVYKHVDANGVVTYSDQAMPGARLFRIPAPGQRAALPALDEPLDYRVRLDTHRHAAGETLRVHNEMFAPVEIELRLEELDNVSGAPERPLRWILPPRSQIRLLTLAPRDPSRPLRYTPKLTHALGDPRLLPRPYRYPLPWVGGPFRKTQGANGSYSHFTAKGRYAVDIAMPEGTPILAARAGVVVATLNDQAGAGPNPAGNFVRILHDDGTMGVYLHLQRGSLQVAPGQRVRAGARIAASGNTGRSTGPHLHFVVQRNVGLAVESIPFQFAQPVDSLPNFAVGGD
ncbi:peptidoglycan DD-metalloendopeptidase family protein [Pseudomonas stutzeri]|nr:peptidoglycan DD-metalloendopeptidase family protein [Stutzerimonas stutzeri]